MTTQSYKFVVVETTIQEAVNNKLKEKRVINIGLRNLQSGFIIPHPLTHFVANKYEYYGNGVNSQRNAARYLTYFLNYLYEQIEVGKDAFTCLRSKGLKGLTLYHGSCFITYLTTKKGLSYDYVNNIEIYLTNFYAYLSELDLVEEEYEIVEVMVGKRIVQLSPFCKAEFDTQRPPTDHKPKSHLKDFGDNRYLLVREFINTARNVSPEIAFGIALDIFGGIRRGETVNLIRTSLREDPNFGLTQSQINIDDNQHLLFPHLKNTSKEQVKRKRTQSLLPSKLLNDVYKEHMNRLRKVKSNNPYALFVNDDNNPITGSAYEEKFAKVKKVFIEKLRTTVGRYGDYALLSESQWGTHIGRGLFTNFLLDIGLSPDEIRIARGDRSIKSAMEYYCERNGIRNVKSAIKEISQSDESKFGYIDYAKVESGWKMEVFYRGTTN